MSLTLGIDQSYTSCALCLVNDDGDVKEYERFQSDKALDTYARALEVALFISAYVIKHNPKAVKIEGLAFGISGNATRDLAGLLFTIINVLKIQQPKINVVVVAPTQVKKRATGSGKAKKPEMIEALPEHVKKIFTDAGFKKTTGLSDLADAYWIART